MGISQSSIRNHFLQIDSLVRGAVASVFLFADAGQFIPYIPPGFGRFGRTCLFLFCWAVAGQAMPLKGMYLVLFYRKGAE